MYLDRSDAVRTHRACLLPRHGDSHLGNVFFHEIDGSAGFYDMQNVVRGTSADARRGLPSHPAGDGADLARNERAYVEVYLKRLAVGQRLSRRRLATNGPPSRLTVGV